MKLPGTSLSALVLLVSAGCNLTGSDLSGTETGVGGASASATAGGTSGTPAGDDEVADAGSSAVVQRTATGWSGECEQFEAESDYVWDSEGEVSIGLNGTDISSQSSAVSFHGRCVTISASGNYRLSGNLINGCISVDSDDQGVVRLILDNVEVTSSQDAALHVVNAKKTVIVLADGSTNVLSDSANYASSAEANAALYSQDDLIITGNGALTVNGKYNDAITSKNGLIIKSGAIAVSAVDDGIRGKDCLVVKGGSILAQTGGDALKADNEDDTTLGYVSLKGGSFDLTAAGDGVSATTSVYMTNGNLIVKTGGGSGQSVAADSSAKGIKGAAGVVIDGGKLQISAADDGVHAGSAVYLNGGELTIATSDDGIHSDASVEITGGSIKVTQSYEGIEGTVIELTEGTIHVVSSDDGLNASDGSGSTATDPGAAAAGVVAAGGATGVGMDRGTRPAGPGTAPGSMDPGAMGFAGTANRGNAFAPVTTMFPIDSGGASGTAPASASTTSTLLISIGGGRLVVDASGDGLDSNGSIAISGGTVLVSGPVDDANAALDKGDGQECSLTISGGFLVAAGSAGMAEAPSAASTQNSVFLTTGSSMQGGSMQGDNLGGVFGTSTSKLAAGTLFQLLSSDGAELVTYAPAKTYAAVIFSSPRLVTGTYSVQTGATCTGVSTDNLYERASCSGGTQRANVTLGTTITTTTSTWSL